MIQQDDGEIISAEAYFKQLQIPNINTFLNAIKIRKGKGFKLPEFEKVWSTEDGLLEGAPTYVSYYRPVKTIDNAGAIIIDFKKEAAIGSCA